MQLTQSATQVIKSTINIQKSTTQVIQSTPQEKLVSYQRNPSECDTSVTGRL